MPTSESSCAHCRQALSPGQARFCCNGCEAVYAAITGHGLKDYYQRQDAKGKPASMAVGDYAYLDDPVLEAGPVFAIGQSRATKLLLEGVHCTACLWLLEKLPSVLPGVQEARLSYGDSRLKVVWDPSRVRLSEIGRCLAELGYPPHLMSEQSAQRVVQRNERMLLARIGIAGAAFGNVMLLSFALYSAEGTPMVDFKEGFFRWAAMLIAVPSVLWTAQPFFKGARAALRTRSALVDLPISVGISAALLGGTVATIRGSGAIYFDSVTMLVFFLLVGRYVQSRGQQAARSATDLMFALAPSTSRLIGLDGTPSEVPTGSVPVGSQVEVLAGERIGVDGRITHGQSTLDESLLSGESRPRPARVGETVHAGTVNLEGRLLIEATQTGAQTRLAHLVAEVEQAASNKAPIVALADRASGVFAWAILLLAIVTTAVWWHLGAVSALERALALLIVTCPCALGLATPLATSVALGRAATAGLLIKGGQFLEALARPGLVVFDKTGTLTQGKLQLAHWEGDLELARLVRAAESESAHPIAAALRKQLPATAASTPSHFEESQGGGVRATVEGRQVVIGNGPYVARHLSADESAQERLIAAWDARTEVTKLRQRGLSALYIAVDGQLQSITGMGDPIRSEAADCLRRLRAMGYRLAIASGDEAALVARVAKELGVPFECVRAAQSPGQKLAYIQQQSKRRAVFMVGDGVNDAAALSAATVGVAVHGGAETSVAAADVFSTHGGVTPVVTLIEGARRTLSTIRQNLAFSLIYNVLTAGLAICGWISPLLAAVLMPLSSLTVLANSLRAHSFGELRSSAGAKSPSSCSPPLGGAHSPTRQPQSELKLPSGHTWEPPLPLRTHRASAAADLGGGEP